MSIPGIFRNLPFCESSPPQSFANLGFNRSKIFLKQTQVAWIVTPMNHAVTVGTQHRKIFSQPCAGQVLPLQCCETGKSYHSLQTIRAANSFFAINSLGF
jgi:hypothetical protein